MRFLGIGKERCGVLVICAMLCLVWPDVCRAGTVADSAARVGARLDVVISYDTAVHDSWGSVGHAQPSDTAHLLRYLSLLELEYSKYPPGYLRHTGVDTIKLLMGLSIAGQSRAAIPDVAAHTLYLSIDGAYRVSTDEYLIHCMHHELHHFADHISSEQIAALRHRWHLINPHVFRAGSSGTIAYRDSATDYYTVCHPVRGFLNLYSMTAEEEDRAEMAAFIMSDMERPCLTEYGHKDRKLRRKADLMMRMLDVISGANSRPPTPPRGL